MDTVVENREVELLEEVTPEQGAPELEGQGTTRSGALARLPRILLTVGMGLLLLIAVGSVALLHGTYETMAALREQAGAFEALQTRNERERQVRRWIVTQNPKALMADFDELPGVLLDRAAEHDLDYRVVMAVIQKESRWEPDAVGKDGEIGLMQIRPATAAHVAEKLGIDFVPPKRDGRGGYADLGSLGNPGVNIRLGMAYLRAQIDEFGMQPEALQAYNRGPRRARLSWLWDGYAADVARNFGALVLWEGFPAIATSEATSQP